MAPRYAAHVTTPLPRVAVLLGLFALAEISSPAYMVRGAADLGELQKTADVVFKGTVVSDGPAPGPHSDLHRTKFKVISVLKGTLTGDSTTFDHADNLPQSAMFGMGPPPTHYHFDTGRTYLVFAKTSGTPGVLKPLWDNPTTLDGQGVILCADDKPVAAAQIKDEIWAQLTGLLKPGNDADNLYAIHQLDNLSGWGDTGKNAFHFQSTNDLDRKPVVDAIHAFVASPDAKMAQAAIEAVGSHNPYMTQERAQFWLATIGSGEIDGLSKMDAKMGNLGGELYSSDLLAVAGKAPDDATRALAIRALGLVRKPEVGQHLMKFLSDPSPAVRAAAMVVLADYPGLATSPQLSRMGVDPDQNVRIAVAQCIGFGQNKAGLELLSRMLTDPALDVRKAAAQSLLSFSAKDPAVAAIFKANLQTDFAPVFVNALAKVDAAPYRDELLHQVETYSPYNGSPDWWWGGEVPAGEARTLLFKSLRTVPGDQLKSGKFDRYLDAIEKGALGNFGMGYPLEVYAFEIRHGLTTRAEAFRAAALKAQPFQQAVSYDQARSDPSIYDQ